MEVLINQLQGFVLSLGVFTGSIIIGFLTRFLFIRIFKTIAKRSESVLFQSMSRHLQGPFYLLFPLIAVSFSMPLFKLTPEISNVARQALSILFTLTVSWLIAKFMFVIEDLVLSRYRLDVEDNLQARKIYTQIQFFKKAVVIFIGILALAIILTNFEKVRQLGATILASAGVIGIIIGFAARQSIATLVAGLQIAITQPFRIDDVVIVENEWGRIEEITLTYVVVRIWDLRRLVLPITYFIEKPFQNWTRVSADILGTVFLYVDYTVPVQEIREELHTILQGSQYWDGKVWNLQVTNASERTVELRALMSAPDASTAWNLRCEVREKLLLYIQENYPYGLPKLRGEIVGEAAHRK